RAPPALADADHARSDQHSATSLLGTNALPVGFDTPRARRRCEMPTARSGGRHCSCGAADLADARKVRVGAVVPVECSAPGRSGVVFLGPTGSWLAAQPYSALWARDGFRG